MLHLTRQRQLPQEVPQVIGQGEQLEPRLVILEPATRQARPLQRVLPLLDPLLGRATAVVEPDHPLRAQPGSSTRRQNLALWWLPRRSMARSRSPNWLKTNRGW